MQIQELTKYSESVFADLVPLMRLLSERCVFTEEKLKAVIGDANSHLYVVRNVLNSSFSTNSIKATEPSDECLEGKIIGCATLCVFHSPTGTKASIEDVVVSEEYRGLHLGKQLMEYVLKEARKFAPIELHLTSNPKRVAANKLYQSLGFEKKDTNAYVMMIE